MPDDQLTEEKFVKTHSRDETGRYVVSIPRKVNFPKLGNSSRLAFACFLSLERKFKRDPGLFKRYKEVVDDYRAAGHMIMAAKDNMKWRFITPAAPHQGGVWEAAFKQMRRHLKRSVGDGILSRDKLAQLTSQIEGCLNSRPLHPLTDDH